MLTMLTAIETMFTSDDRLMVVLAGDERVAALLLPKLRAALDDVAAELCLTSTDLRALLGQCKDTEQEVMHLRFSNTQPRLGLAETGERLGISRERVRAREARALLRMRTDWSKGIA